jgi:hypothetical protein
MNYIITGCLIFVIVILLTSCGNQGSSIDVSQVQTCTVSNNTITCPDGSKVTLPTNNFSIVQFCPGVTTYPQTFSEIGFCINNQLYAVYSIPNAFLTLVPPGMYSSNGINSSCTFNVGLNCEVSL